jgi:hypothetical protein
VNAIDALSRAVGIIQDAADKSSRPFWRSVRESAAAVTVITLIGLLLSTVGIPRALSRAAMDATYVGATPQSAERVFIVKIDSEDDRVLLSNRRPMSDSVLERLLQAVAAGGATVIVVDLPTTHNSSTMRLPDAVPVVWQLEWNEASARAEAALGGVIKPIDKRGGVSLSQLDSDGIVRGHRRDLRQADGTVVASIVKAAMNAVGEEGRFSSANEVMVTVPYQVPQLTAGAVIRAAETAGSRWHDLGPVRGRVVVISAHTAPVVATSRGPREGYEVVADAIESELQHTVASSGSVLGIGTAQAIGMVLVIFAYRRWRLAAALWVTVATIPMVAIVAGLIVFGDVSSAAYFVPFLLLVLIQQLYSKAATYARAIARLDGVVSHSSPTTTKLEGRAQQQAAVDNSAAATSALNEDVQRDERVPKAEVTGS